MKSRAAMVLRRAALSVCGLSLVACASLPVLSFDQDSGGAAQAEDSGAGYPPGTLDAAATGDAEGTPGGGPASDGSADDGTAGDAALVDAGGTPSDSGSGMGGICPVAPPSGADLCCGAIACVGKKCANRCTDCATTCTVTQVCCAPNGNGTPVTCTSSIAACN